MMSQKIYAKTRQINFQKSNQKNKYDKRTTISEVGNLKSNKTLLCKAMPTMSIKKGSKQIKNSRRLTKRKITYKKGKNAYANVKGVK